MLRLRMRDPIFRGAGKLDFHFAYTFELNLVKKWKSRRITYTDFCIIQSIEKNWLSFLTNRIPITNLSTFVGELMSLSYITIQHSSIMWNSYIRIAVFLWWNYHRFSFPLLLQMLCFRIVGLRKKKNPTVRPIDFACVFDSPFKIIML